MATTATWSKKKHTQFFKYCLAAELLRKTCKGGLILQHRCLLIVTFRISESLVVGGNPHFPSIFIGGNANFHAICVGGNEKNRHIHASYLPTPQVVINERSLKNDNSFMICMPVQKNWHAIKFLHSLTHYLWQAILCIRAVNWDSRVLGLAGPGWTRESESSL